MTVMRQAPAIAILSPNVLTAIGLRSILEKVAPAAETELFGSFRDFEAAGPERFFHYFVTARLFVAHAAFFRERRHKTIVLSSGEPHLAARGMHCLDVRTAEERLVSSLLRLQRSARRPEHALTAPPHAAQTLSDREAEVLTLIAEGLLNKQIAQRLGIGLTTVISHRRNIMEKLGIRSVAGLVVYALTEGYAPTDDMLPPEKTVSSQIRIAATKIKSLLCTPDRPICGSCVTGCCPYCCCSRPFRPRRTP